MVGGGPSRHDWRVICPCQNHRRSLFQRVTSTVQRRFEQASRSSMRLLVGLPVVLSAVVVPMQTLQVIPTESRDTAVRIVRAKLLLEVDFPAAAPVITQRIVPFDPTYVTESFPDAMARALVAEWMMEKVREEYFRQEIPYGWVIYREAKKNGLPPELVAAVVHAESNFRPALISHKNAQGLMQIIPTTGMMMGANDLMDPVDNVRTGTKYLRYLYRRFGDDTRLVLAAYNAGEGNVIRFGGVPPFRETRGYLKKVAESRRLYAERMQERVQRILDEGQFDELSIFTQ
jgi:soluble lytic murein transglycosylase-like protein